MSRILVIPTLLIFSVVCWTQEKASQPQSGQWPLPTVNHFSVDILNQNINPCDNFYQYVCSNWMAANPIPPDQPAWGTGFDSNLELYNQTILRNALQAAATAKNRDAVHQKIGDYWTSCMNETEIDQSALKPIQPDLDRIAAMKSVKELPDVLAIFQKSYPSAWTSNDNQTATALFGYGPIIDYNDATLVVGGFDQGGLSLPSRDFYLSDNKRMQDIRRKFVSHVQRMLELAGEKLADAQSHAATILRIETYFAKLQMDNVKRRDPVNLNNIMSLQQVKALAPSFDWSRYLKLIGSPEPKHYLVSTPDFFRGLEPILKQESLDAWKTYLRWWILHGSSSYLSKSFVEESFNFFGATLNGLQQNEPRWRRCVGYADRDLGEALGQAYVDVAFSAESKLRMKEMVKAIEEALAQDIQTLDWMTPATKKQAEMKLKAIYDKIGYPDKWRDYSSMKVVPDNLVGNLHQATAFEFKRQLDKIGKPVDREEWTMTPPTINAYYDPQENTINFPAGILQPPFFDPGKGDAENYGAIGLVIGHEISHGFDDQGRKFDAEGKLRDWWTPEDRKRYDEHTVCIEREYTHEVPSLGVKTNGALTLGEDSADNAGLRIALLALENTYKKSGKSLDSRETDGFSPRQKFFLAHAFSWCAQYRPDFARIVVTTNPHSLPEYRVNYVDKNAPEFWKAYGCKKGQAMVSDNSCRVW
jgi:endothelin-converting enzyme/putative endopeptidase